MTEFQEISIEEMLEIENAEVKQPKKSISQLIKDRKIKVISLKSLIEQLENPQLYKEKVMVITLNRADKFNSFNSFHSI